MFPVPLAAYPPDRDDLFSHAGAIASRSIQLNAVATGIFVLAIFHTFSAKRFTEWAHRVQHRHDHREKEAGRRPSPSITAEILHFLGEVEVIFGLWAIVLLLALTARRGWDVAKHYVSDTVTYTEPLFVVVIMALASTRPVITFAEASLQRVARLGGGTPAAWWLAILIHRARCSGRSSPNQRR